MSEFGWFDARHRLLPRQRLGCTLGNGRLWPARLCDDLRGGGQVIADAGLDCSASSVQATLRLSDEYLKLWRSRLGTDAAEN